MIKRPIWTSGWASLCLPVGWFGVTCPFRWEPPRESRQATRESSPWGPAGSRPQQPLGLGAGVCQAAGISGQGRRAGRWPSLPASIVGPCADDLCLTSVSCPHAESSWCNFSEDKCQSSSCSCAGCGGCAQRLGGEKSPWGPAGSLSAGLGVSLCEPRPCGRGRSPFIPTTASGRSSRQHCQLLRSAQAATAAPSAVRLPVFAVFYVSVSPFPCRFIGFWCLYSH